MTRYEFTVQGETKLLMHQDNIQWADDVDVWRKDPENKNLQEKGSDRSPAWTWIGSLYHDGECVAMPFQNMQRCLITGGSRLPFKGAKTYKEMAASGICFEQDYMTVLVAGKTIPLGPIMELRDTRVTEFPKHVVAAKQLGFELLMKRAPIGMKKHIRVRPMFNHWSFSGSIQVTGDITESALNTIFVQAGRAGIGDWRPSSKTPGRYGTFKHTLKRT